MCAGLDRIRIAFIALAIINGVYAFVSLMISINILFYHLLLAPLTENESVFVAVFLRDLFDITLTIIGVIGILRKKKVLQWLTGVLSIFVIILCFVNIFVEYNSFEIGKILWVILIRSLHVVFEIIAGILLAFILFDRRYSGR